MGATLPFEWFLNHCVSMSAGTIPTTDLLTFCHRTIEGMTRAIAWLDDELANTQPDLPNANTPAQIVVHSLSACEWWVRAVVCGDEFDRDRDAEFEAKATTNELQARCAAAKQLLTDLAPRVAEATEVHFDPVTRVPLGQPWTVGAALMHAYEELAQHLGHLEITVDLLLAARA